jgi:hypothetical protein
MDGWFLDLSKIWERDYVVQDELRVAARAEDGWPALLVYNECCRAGGSVVTSEGERQVACITDRSQDLFDRARAIPANQVNKRLRRGYRLLTAA